jgi:hypothetical protein
MLQETRIIGAVKDLYITSLFYVAPFQFLIGVTDFEDISYTRRVI